jgi:AcrR family transcriptional regulator
MRVESNTYHHGDLRRELIRVATEVVKKEGVDALTIRGVSSTLNVSRTAPYRHFKDKDELLCAIAKQGYHIFGKSMQQVWDEHLDLSPVERFVAVGQSYINFSCDYPEYYLLMFGSSGLLRSDNAQLKQESDATFNFLQQMLAFCQQQGAFLAEDTLLQARYVWCALHGYCSIIIANDEQTSTLMKQDSHQFLQKIIDGLCVR